MELKRLINLRKSSHLTQKQIAEYLSIVQSTYSDYERGKINIPIDVLIKLADLYGTSVDYLIGRTRKKPL